MNKEGKTIPFEKAEEMGIELDCEQVPFFFVFFG